MLFSILYSVLLNKNDKALGALGNNTGLEKDTTHLPLRHPIRTGPDIRKSD